MYKMVLFCQQVCTGPSQDDLVHATSVPQHVTLASRPVAEGLTTTVALIGARASSLLIRAQRGIRLTAGGDFAAMPAPDLVSAAARHSASWLGQPLTQRPILS